MSEAKIIIEDYNPLWPKMFEQEKTQLSYLLGNNIEGAIEHVGSTSVKGLAAKPIIDIMIGVKSLESSLHLITTLTDYGYCYYPYKPEIMHWFCKPSPEVRTHHLHLVPYLSPLWHERIKFRDVLRKNLVLAEQYQTLKYQLAEQYVDDREQYTLRKWPFIEKALKSQ